VYFNILSPIQVSYLKKRKFSNGINHQLLTMKHPIQSSSLILSPLVMLDQVCMTVSHHLS